MKDAAQPFLLRLGWPGGRAILWDEIFLVLVNYFCVIANVIQKFIFIFSDLRC